MFGIGIWELLAVLLVVLLLFGSRLPSLARSFGQSITEFKKGMNDLTSEVKTSVYSEPTARVGYTDQSEPAGTRFEPPKA